MYLLSNFKRTKGSKDKQKRKSRLLGKVALSSLGLLATGAYLKKRGLKDLNSIKQKTTKYKNKITKNSSGNEGLDLAFKFKQEVNKRKKLNKPKVKNYTLRRALNDPFFLGSTVSAGSLIAYPFLGKLVKGRNKPKKEKK